MKKDVSKQEEVVSALYRFAHAQQTRAMTSTSVPLNGDSKDITRVNLDAVGEALEKIMNIFGHEVVPIQ